VDRYGSISEFCEALASSIDADHGSAGSASGSGRALRGGRLKARGLLATAALLAIIAGAAVVVHPWRSGSPKPIRSLAVLPLSNVSGDPKEEYYSDGMTEELILELSKISALRVISRTSVMSLKNAGLSLSEIGHRLGVDAILEGTFARSKDRLRVSLQLFRVKPERQLWGERYDRPAAGALQLQTEIARAVAGPVEVELTPAEQARFDTRRAVSPEAHEAFLRGRFALNTFDAAHMRLALDQFNAAIAADPQYVAAWTGLAQTYYQMSNIYLPPSFAIERARGAARQALTLDPQLASAHTAMGTVLAQYDWRFAEAEREYRAALALDPSDSDCHFYLGYLLLESGRLPEGLKVLEEALRLDPLNSYKADFVAYSIYCARHYAKAEQNYREILVSSPNDVVARYSLALPALATGRTDDAIALLEPMIQKPENTFPIALLGNAYGRAGRRADAQRMLALLEQQGKKQHLRPTDFAVVYVGMGDKGRAMDWIERAYAEHDENLLTAGVDPLFDSLRGDERFRKLIRRIGSTAT
jgi:TolB-like protein/Tfp pilus assembly protein PilF